MINQPLLLAVTLLAVPLRAQAAAAAAALDFADSLVQPLIDGRVTVGLALGILRDGEVAVRGYGLVAKGREARPDGDTVYEIGSISKVFTGVLLADAVTNGLVRLADPVSGYVPDGIVVPKWQDTVITLSHLTTHTSALPRLPPNLTTAQAVDPYAAYDRAQLYAGLAVTELQRAPGARYEYSNFAVGLLGQLLVDRQQSASYEQLLRARICDPLRLGDTRCTLTAAMRQRLAPPYDDAGRAGHNWQFQSLAGAGAIRSTVRDMLRFAQANLTPRDGGREGGRPAGRVARAQPGAQRDAQPAAQPDAADPEVKLRAVMELARQPCYVPSFIMKAAGQPTVACGWHLGASEHLRWHNGATGGYRSHLLLDTERKWAVVVLANTTSPLIDQVAQQVYRAMTGAKVTPLEVRKALEVPMATLQRYAGKYQLAPTMVIDVAVEEGVLTARLTGQARFPLFAIAATRFFYRVTPAEIEFAVEDGKATRLTLFQNGKELPAPRIE